MNRLKFVFVLLLLVIATAASGQSLTENFESWSAAYFYHSGQQFNGAGFTINGGQLLGVPVQNDVQLPIGVVYASAGFYIDPKEGPKPFCYAGGCSTEFTIRFDTPAKYFDFYLHHATKTSGVYIIESGQFGERITVPFNGPGRRNVVIPWKNITTVHIKAPVYQLDPVKYPGLENWQFAIDDLTYTLRQPVRVLTGAGSARTSPVIADKIATDGMEMYYPLGLPFFLKIQQRGSDGIWRDVNAQFKTYADAEMGPQPGLFPFISLFRYGQLNDSFKAFQTVHLGKSWIEVTPSGEDPFDVIVHTLTPSALGTAGGEGSTWDKKISEVADIYGIPPQYVKAHVRQEGNFNPERYRYEPLTVDWAQMWSGTSTHRSYIDRGHPWRNYTLPMPADLGEGPHLCPPSNFTRGYPMHNCAFIGLDDLAPRWSGPPYLHIPEGNGTRRIAPGDGFDLPLTIRQIYNASNAHMNFNGTDPSPQYGPTRSGNVSVTASGRRRRACCSSPPANPGDKLLITAQTPMAASYGLLQFVAAHAPDAPNNWPGVNGRFNPTLLMDRADNFTRRSASIYLGMEKNVRSYLVRTGRTVDDVSFDTEEQFQNAMRLMFSGYNPRSTYPGDVMSHFPNYLPVAPSYPFAQEGCPTNFFSWLTPSVSAPAGTAVNLGVRLSSAVRPEKIQWYEGTTGDISRPVPLGDAQYVTVHPNSATKYWVRVHATCGVRDSSTVNVSIRQLCTVPSLQQPAGQVIDYGQPATLRASASGATSYTWYRSFGADHLGVDGDRSHPIGTGPEITVNPLETTPYWVEARNSCAPALSKTITVEVHPCIQPHVSLSATRTSLTDGESTTLTASATGTEPYTYAWFEHGSLINGATSSSISVTPSSTTSYSVRLTNACGTDTASRTITVCTPPSISIQPQPKTITAGEWADLSISTTGTTPLTYAWFTTAGAAAGTSRTISVTPSETTSYYVRVSNSCGNVQSSTVKVTVNSPPCDAPAIGTQPSSATIVSGGSAPLSVTASGTDPLTYAWFTSAGVQAGSGASISVSPSDTTSYYARVSNSCGSAQSATITITVTPACTAPAIATQPSGSSITAGQSAPLSVSATGTLPLTYEWFTTTGTPAGSGASINVSPTTTTSYFVRVSNSCGTVDSAPATITVTAACTSPAITTQPSGSSITAGQSAPLSASATGTAPLSYQWFTTSGTPAGSGASINVSPTTTTSYFVRVSNSCGTVDSAPATITVTSACTSPQISVPPANTSIVAGQNATLSVTANGTAPLSYQWFTSTGAPAGGNSSSVTVSPTSTTSYYVVVSNSCGSVQSATATVTVTAACTAPSIATQPSSTSINAGQSALLFLSANGTAPLSYQWFTAGGILAGSTASISVTPSSTTSYYVRVSNACGTVQSQTVTVTVTQACVTPSITTQPAGTSITAGQSATLSIAASGTTPLSYQWFSVSPAALLGTSSTLTVSPQQTTSYYAVVSNSCGNTQSMTVTVSVCHPPAITQPPANAAIVAGQSTTLSVMASGSTPLSYAWYTAAGALVSTSRTPSVSPSQTTSYYVVVSNSCGNVTSAQVTVTVTPACNPVNIVQQPQGGTIDAGDSFTLSAAANGTEPITYRWYADGWFIAEGQEIFVTPAQTTSYYVEASNACSSEPSVTVVVEVNTCQPASITQGPQDQSITAGQAATLSVSASGTEPLSIQWFANGSPIGSGPSISVSPSQTTTYEVRVQNSCGLATAQATVSVCHPVQIVSQMAGGTVTAGTSINLSVSATGTEPFSYQWFANGSLFSTSPSVTVTPTEATTYSVRVENACGSDTTSTTFLVCTPPSITSDPQDASIASGQSATLSVSASGSDLQYDWFTTGGTLVGSGTSISVSPSATTSYYARVSNGCGSVNSAAATVTVSCMPVIVEQPHWIGPQLLKVTAASSSPLHYSWSYSYGFTEWGAWGGDSDTVETFPSLLPIYWRVIVSNECGAVESEHFYIAP